MQIRKYGIEFDELLNRWFVTNHLGKRGSKGFKSKETAIASAEWIRRGLFKKTLGISKETNKKLRVLGYYDTERNTLDVVQDV